MSFFIRKRQRGRGSKSLQLPSKLTDKAGGKERGRGRGGSKRSRTSFDRTAPPPKTKREDEEITSEEDDDDQVEEELLPQDNDEVEETEQEARIRLAKETLAQLKSRVGDDEDLLADALHHQQLLERGSVLQSVCGDDHATKDLNVRVLIKGGKVLKSPLTSVILDVSNPSIIYISTKSGHIMRFNSGDSQKIHRKLDSPVNSMSSTPLHLAVSTTPAIMLLHPTTLETTHTFNSSRNSIQLASTSEYLYSTHKDRTVKVWNLQERAYVESLFGHQDVASSVDIVPGPNHRVVTAGGWDRTLRLWKIEEESQLVYHWDCDLIEVCKVLNGGYFVAGSSNGDLGLFSFGRKKPLSTVQQAHGCVNGVPSSIDSLTGAGDFVVSGGTNLMKVWRVRERKLEWVRDIDLQCEGVVVSLSVVVSEVVKVVVGVSYEARNGRWGGRIGKGGCRVLVLEI